MLPDVGAGISVHVIGLGQDFHYHTPEYQIQVIRRFASASSSNLTLTPNPP